MTVVLEYLTALTPPAAIGFVFYRIIRSILEADRRERRALAEWNAEHQATSAPEAPTATDGSAEDTQ